MTMERSYPSQSADGNTLEVPYSGLALGVDEAGEVSPLKVSDSGLLVDHSTTGLGHGVKVVASAGTDEALVGSATPAKWVIIQAQTDNSGIVAVGATGVDATVATGTGVALAAGESVSLLVTDLADIFVDATTSGEGVRFTYGS